ncbi:PAS domain-containing sensor histidine kinase [Akkermansiaceae bacterium]|nr:PAS domain-containing sensor histidine kinase [Akkermansiaceae bacterium]MDB4282319.1 PAS domain-containing sensor histidine kinase [Akkermansiaceae bacterium]MDB4309974.1 PAS domain-containing sensor histidine kinase [Akkermansiaceae bacterium]MDC0286873.1 PAS domain-containing sensor histidine kinase [Akkermansiaceae bacterium]
MSYLWFTLALLLGVGLVISRRKLGEIETHISKERKGGKASITELIATHEREINRLLDAFPAPFFSIDQSGNIIRYNKAAAGIFRERDINNRSFQQIFIDSSLSRAIKKARDSGQPESSTIHLSSKSPFSTASGGQESVWEIDIRTHSIRRDQGELQLMMRDITSAVRSDQIRQDFVANASHELRTPLSIIVGYLEILLEPDGLEQPQMATKMLGTMNRHVERINRIVDDMLLISRLESQDAAPLKIEPFCLRNCAEDIVERLDLLIEKQKVTIEIDIPDLGFRGDPFYWTQILFNLVENALKQNAALSVKVVVAAREIEDQKVEITITDNGIGIPNADLPFIFKRFFRVEKHHGQNAIKGTGLGLSIVKRAIEAHHGTISATSTPGHETTFRIVVPT